MGKINMNEQAAGLYKINNTDIMWYWNGKRWERPNISALGRIIKPFNPDDCSFIRDEDQIKEITHLKLVSYAK